MHANEKVGTLVNLAKSINYLQKKKQEYEVKEQNLVQTLQYTKEEM
jgi:hypothetical protein